MSTQARLPAIDIAISHPSREFLEAIAEIAEASDEFRVERHRDALGEPGSDVVNFRYLRRSPHVDVGGQLISRAGSKRVSVEMRASRWMPDPPTRDIYCAVAKELIGPLLTAYNRARKTRYRLRIEKAAHAEPTLPPEAAKLFSTFATLANTSSLHPVDWQRFYEFVRNSRTEISEEDMTALLVKSGVDAPYAEHISGIYRHLWTFKRTR